MRISVEGADPDGARQVLILVHGGGSRASDFLGLSQEFEEQEGRCWLAPQAMHAYWFPQPLDAPRAEQEPYLTVSALSLLGLLQQHPEPPIVLMGFADGAGVVAEVLAHPDLPANVVGAWLASGGLVGEPEFWPSLPLGRKLHLLITGDPESPTLAPDRLESTARVYASRGAKVERFFTQGTSPGITAGELSAAQNWLAQVLT